MAKISRDYLAGHKAYNAGETCPTDGDARDGWLAAEAANQNRVDVKSLDTRTAFERGAGITFDDGKKTLFAHTTTATRGRFENGDGK